MKKYECLYIVNSNYDGDGITRILDKVREYLETNGAKIANVQSWGKRRLAYQIEKQRYGNYVLVHFEGETDNVAFQKLMEMDDTILAYMVVRLDKFPEFEKTEVPPTEAEEVKNYKKGPRGDYKKDAVKEEPKAEKVVEETKEAVVETTEKVTEEKADEVVAEVVEETTEEVTSEETETTKETEE